MATLKHTIYKFRVICIPNKFNGFTYNYIALISIITSDTASKPIIIVMSLDILSDLKFLLQSNAKQIKDTIVIIRIT